MTKLIYLEDQNLYQTKAQVLEILETEKGKAIVLDQTIFYVQGGGQPGDKGLISNSDGIFEVTKTVFDEGGIAMHLGSFIEREFKQSQEVDLKIDVPSRQLNSKIHSAGHLIDLAVKNCGFDWVPGKGFHYPEGSYVEYTAAVVPADLEDARVELQEGFDNLVSQNLEVQTSFDSTQVFKGNTLRKITFAGRSEIRCGGTHVGSTSELEGFKITKIKVKSGAIKVSYALISD